MTPPAALDVLIVGGGAVGLSLFTALRQLPLRVALVERQAEPPAADGRVLAVSAGAQQWLAAQRLWPADLASPITAVEIAIPGQRQPERLDSQAIARPALGYVLPLAELTAGLWCSATGDGFYPGWQVTALQPTGAFVWCHLQSATARCDLTARLVVLADGGHSLPELTGKTSTRHDYAQSALVFSLHAQGAVPGCAYECFTGEGVLALLPAAEQLAAIWVMPRAAAEGLLALPSAAFLEALRPHLPASVMPLGLSSAVTRFEPQLRLASRRPLTRVLTLGNAAQTLHPVGGQGLNLGLRDVECLSRVLAAARDPGAEPVLARFQRERRLDQAMTVGLTHTLAQAFASQRPRLTALQRLGFSALPGVLRHSVLQTLVFGWRS